MCFKDFLIISFSAIFFLICLLVSVAYLTLIERKVLAAMQLRKGPSVVGVAGLLQPFADGLKLLLKETIFPRNASIFIFLLSPCLAFVLSLLSWVVIPFDFAGAIANIDLGVFFILAISSLNVYSLVLAGWSSNSKYAFLGAIRSAAQLISYELSLGFILLSILLPVGSLNLSEIVLFQKSNWLIIPFFPLGIIFFIVSLAETNRTPFDLPEAEAELVAGYNVEYSAMSFAFFFLAEYCSMILMSALFTILFLGGWLLPLNLSSFMPHCLVFAFKVTLILFVFIWVRATLPRYRFDQLLSLGWKSFLPFTFAYFTIEFLLLRFIC